MRLNLMSFYRSLMNILLFLSSISKKVQNSVQCYFLLGIFLVNINSIDSNDSIFQNTEFYYNYAQDINESSSERVLEILSKGIIDLWKDPRNLKAFEVLEQASLFKDFIKYKKVMSAVINLELLTMVDEKRYFYMRESIRRVSRASIDTSVEKAVNLLIESDLIAVFIDSQFRSMIVPLVKSGYLQKYFSIIGDLNYFEKDLVFKAKWESLYKRYLKVNYASDAKVISLMELVKDKSEQVKSRARSIRDSGFYEIKLTLAQEKILKSQLYKVYQSYFNNDQWANAIQLLTKKKLFFKAIQIGEEKVASYFKRILKKKLKIEKELLEDFISSKIFESCLSANSSSIYLFLQETDTLKKFVYNLDAIQFLIEQSKTPQFKKSQLSLALKKKKIGNDERLKKKKKIDSESCYQNMSKMMAVREKFSKKMRKKVHIKTVEDRIEFFKETGLKLQVCPTGGKYLSSKFGRIQCTYHGDAPIIHVE